MLEAAQRSRPRSAPIRLAAMALHGLLGAATSAMDSFDALDIKHIQHDTLSGKPAGNRHRLPLEAAQGMPGCRRHCGPSHHADI